MDVNERNLIGDIAVIVTMNRRVLLGLCACGFAGVASVSAVANPSNMSAKAAHTAAKAGDVLLVDVPTRDEWKKSGIGEHAHAVSMHEKGFVK